MRSQLIMGKQDKTTCGRDNGKDGDNNFISMLSFEQQEKVLGPILMRPTNKHCADCGSTSPTWASLDFGVFVCSNCSGAHRALGPTITRIKSTKLDQWKSEWVSNMLVGNEEINQFWECPSIAASIKKPSSGASPDEYCRYVYDKYVRRKYVAKGADLDPLTAYKKDKFNSGSLQHNPDTSEQYEDSVQTPKSEVAVSKVENLLDDFLCEPQQERKLKHENYSTKSEPSNDDDEFDEFVEAAPVLVHEHPPVDPSILKFDQLFSNQAPHQPPINSLPLHNWPPHPSHSQQHQWAHNPYVGYNHMHTHQHANHGYQPMGHNPIGHPMGNVFQVGKSGGMNGVVGGYQVEGGFNWN